MRLKAVLQSGQIVRTSRWAMTPSTVLATRNGSTPMSIRRVKALGASFVCSVLNTMWPVSDAWMAALGRLQVADFADQDHVRVVPQDRPQGGGERQADLGVRLNLADAVLLVLDRVLDRDDLGRLVLDLVEGRVERRRLAGAGRAGDEHDAVRPVDHLLERAVDVRQHAEVLQVERPCGPCRADA